MTIPRIYCPLSFFSGNQIKLTPIAHRHLLKSLRLRAGDRLIVFDGKGQEFNGILQLSEKNEAMVQVGDAIERATESPLYIHLVYGMGKLDKTEFVIQKAVELGINKITPIMTQHGEVHLPEKSIQNRLERWHSILASACEQAYRSVLPEIEKPLRFKDWIKRPHEGTCLIFHPKGRIVLSELPLPETRKTTLLVGPEGGFSENEIESVVEKGFEIIKMGPRILRTETAAVSAMSVVQALWGDLL